MIHSLPIPIALLAVMVRLGVVLVSLLLAAVLVAVAASYFLVVHRLFAHYAWNYNVNHPLARRWPWYESEKNRMRGLIWLLALPAVFAVAAPYVTVVGVRAAAIKVDQAMNGAVIWLLDTFDKYRGRILLGTFATLFGVVEAISLTVHVWSVTAIYGVMLLSLGTILYLERRKRTSRSSGGNDNGTGLSGLNEYDLLVAIQMYLRSLYADLAEINRSDASIQVRAAWLSEAAGYCRSRGALTTMKHSADLLQLIRGATIGGLRIPVDYQPLNVAARSFSRAPVSMARPTRPVATAFGYRGRGKLVAV